MSDRAFERELESALAGRREQQLYRQRRVIRAIDAVRASEQMFRIFPHNDLSKLQRLLEERNADEMQIVVSESIFSMDGDATPLAGLADLKRKHDFVLLLDEAHASGVYGPNGS